MNIIEKKIREKILKEEQQIFKEIFEETYKKDLQKLKENKTKKSKIK